MKKFSKGINGIRGILAIIIALFHFELTFPLIKRGMFRTGYLGVEFFFILSGFLLTKGFYEKNKCDVIENIKSKLKKMYPAYIAALLLLISVFVVKWYDFNYFKWLGSDTNAASFITEVLMLQGFGVSNYKGINGPSWYVSSLLINTIIILLLLKKYKKTYSSILSIILSVIIYLLFFIFDYSMGPEYFIFSLLPSGIIRGFAGMSLGSFTYELTLKSEKKVNKMSDVLYNVVEIITFLVFMKLLLFRDPSRLNFLFFIPSVILIVFMFLREGIIDKIFSFKVFAFLGTISYEFYIFQSPISNFINCWFKDLRQPYVTLLYFVINLVVAIVFYYLVNYLTTMKGKKHGKV